MNLLGIDASSGNISLALMKKGRIILDFNRRIKFGASNLPSYIEKSLKKVSCYLDDIDCFVIGSGPGSFTGLRISFAIVKAFMVSLEKPVIAMSSFFSCAYQSKRTYNKIVVISDARRNLYYSVCFERKGNYIRKIGKEQLLEFNDLIKKSKDCYFVTYDPKLRKKILEVSSGVKINHKDIYPKARYLLKLVNDFPNKFKSTSLEKLKPLYLHPKTCQVRNK